jgi:hypothetical protein
MISVPAFGIEPPDDALVRYREAALTLHQALCIETTIMIGEGAVPCGAHIVLLPIGRAVESLVRALQVRA